jgi:hypothetical protein
MKVTITHHIDASERDSRGKYSYCYEYEMFRFADAKGTLVARGYADEKSSAHFLGAESAGESRALRDDDLKTALFAEAVRYLRNAGKKKLSWLSGRGNGYEPILAASLNRK